MGEGHGHRRRTALLLAAPVVVGFVCRLPGLDRSLNDFFAFRQAQTAFTVREYMRSGIDLTSTPLPVFGPPWEVPFEFPLFQGLAALVAHVTGDASSAARLTGLVFFEVTCVLLGVLALQWFSRTTAVVAVTLFQVTPFAVQWGWASLIETLATAAAIGAVVSLTAWTRRRRGYLLALAVVAQVVAFLVKPTTAAPWLIAFAVPAAAVLFEHRSARRARPVLVATLAASATGLIAGLAWTHHADRVKAASPYTEFVTSSRLTSWNFGTVQQRLEGSEWALVLDGFPSMGGSLLLLASLVAVALGTWKLSLPVLALVAVPVAAIGTFFNLYVVHDYYLLAVYPAVVLVVAAGVAGTARLVPHRTTSVAVGLALTLAVAVLAWDSAMGRSYHANLVTSRPVPPLTQELVDMTSPADGIILVGCDWDPSWLYQADRRGLMIISSKEGDPLPPGWVPDLFSYVGHCGTTAPSTDFLPSSVRLERVSPHLLALRPVAGAGAVTGRS